MQLNPTGYWEAKVRLGMEIHPGLTRPRCGSVGTLHYLGFDSDTGERRRACDNCRRYCRLSEALGECQDVSTLEHLIVARPPSPRREIRT
ncbi:hypothetical protein [Rhizobium sp. BK491]|uniref:hypothetical protein n=1 Tax=Rhizobium sp. BK491 TaxID=2587009 RepID=UPI001FED8753|nr:hypothetical protein [Rhizobium sp. BK491]